MLNHSQRKMESGVNLMEQYFTPANAVTFAIVALAFCWGFNLIYTTVQNARKERERQLEPIVKVNASISEVKGRLDSVERRLNGHDADISDLHAGQSAMCRGVQALLDHELHNGNENEMKAASDGIGKWLRTR